MKRLNITQAATLAGLLGLASLAGAADKPTVAKRAAPAYTDPASLPKLDHVVVINASPAQRAKAQADVRQTGVGQKAYIDAFSGRLRQITPEDLAAEAATTPAPAASSNSESEIATAGGGRAIKLDETSHVYSVATLDTSGKAREVCVGTQPDGKAALSAAAQASEERSHEK